ncbi:PREDICTED: uncharacterized protein LOC106820129, partial [Priapulus caudatus]|uniref:Uncharacterized protein LOC106820129 n=1 Tax=Priapulus caudatus TaxID=37621 RepID=A0ABM1F6U2_PRICU
LASYGGTLDLTFMYLKPREQRDRYLASSDVIIEGRGIRLGYGGRYYRDSYNETISVPLREGEWRLLDEEGNARQLADMKEFYMVLLDVERLLLRASFHTTQTESL